MEQSFDAQSHDKFSKLKKNTFFEKKVWNLPVGPIREVTKGVIKIQQLLQSSQWDFSSACRLQFTDVFSLVVATCSPGADVKLVHHGVNGVYGATQRFVKPYQAALSGYF